MGRKHILVGCCTLLFSLWGYGQQEVYATLFPYQLASYNPAYQGAEDQHQMTLSYRNQWLNIPDAPRSLLLTYGRPMGKRVGLGLNIIADKVFVEQQTFMSLDFSYQLPLTEKTRVYLGLKGGGNFYSARTQSLESYNILSDPAQRPYDRFIPNMGVCLYVQSDAFYFSMAMPRLFEADRDEDRYLSAKDRKHFYMAAGTQFPLNTDWEVKPSVMLRTIKGLPDTIDGLIFLSYQEVFDLGVSYRSNTALSSLLFIKINDMLDLGYAYETPTDRILNGLQPKTHEFTLRIKLGAVGEKAAETSSEMTAPKE